MRVPARRAEATSSESGPMFSASKTASIRQARSLGLVFVVVEVALFSAPLVASVEEESWTWPRIVEVLPLSDRVLMLHVAEGHVAHHKRGMPRSDERVILGQLDTSVAARTGSYCISSSDDPAYRHPVTPLDVGRKSKGTDFAWFVDRWENGYAVNDRPDHVKEHWIYLRLPRPMLRGKHYQTDTGALAANGRFWSIVFDEARVRSEAVHVNLLGYARGAPGSLHTSFTGWAIVAGSTCTATRATHSG